MEREGSSLRRKVEAGAVLESSGAEQSSVVSYFSECDRIRRAGDFSAVVSALGGSDLDQVQHRLHFPKSCFNIYNRNLHNTTRGANNGYVVD